jgi:SAM-dependent methyltransferase
MNLEDLRYGPSRDAQKKVLECADIIGGCGKFLDVGCGFGSLTLEFAHKMGANQVYGVDNDSDRTTKANKVGVMAVCSDITSGLPFDDSFFDVVLCHQVAEHLTDADMLLKEINRVLKSKGKLVISVPNLCSFHNRFFVLFGYQPTVISPSNHYPFGNPIQKEALEEDMGHRHNKAFSPKAFKAMIKYYGFGIDHYFGAGIYFLPRFILQLSPELGVNQIVVASKNN